MTIETKSEVSKLAELTHGVLLASKSGTKAHTHRQSALNTTMSARARRRKTRRLEGKDLVLGELLLVKSLLLLLQGFNLVLDRDLQS